MATIQDIIIINEHLLRLNQDAKKGDEIDLHLLKSIDTTILSRKIDQAADQEYNKRLDNLKNQMQLEKENDIQKALKDSHEKITELKQVIKSQEETIEAKVSKSFELQIQALKNQVSQLQNEKDHMIQSKDKDIELAISSKMADLKDEINQYKNKIEQLNQEKETIINKLDLEKQIAVQNKEKDLKEIIQEKENQISKLNLEKSSLNIKKMGEELEQWVDQEYQNHALSGFDTCSWEKDNEVVKLRGESKGSKADFIFKVYATEDRLEEDLLTSVACEVKSEDPNSSYKKKNADHYDKLDLDRQKKHCEYALLISELEWNTSNDAPIRKVQGYDKMYMVRPQYFIVFLSIIKTLSFSYKDAIQGFRVEKYKFKNAEDIINELDMMKEDILDKSIRYIKNKMEEINNSAESIKKEAQKILDASRVIMESHIETVINKIKAFKVNHLIDKIETIESK